MNEKITVLIDTREQTPLAFQNLKSELSTLATGDYSIKGFEPDFCIERKSIADLVQSVTFERDRFERELVRMRGYEFRRLLVIGTLADIEAHRYRSLANPKAVIASLTAFEIRYQLPVTWCLNPTAAALQIERWAVYYLRERLTTARAMLNAYENTYTITHNEPHSRPMQCPTATEERNTEHLDAVGGAQGTPETEKGTS